MKERVLGKNKTSATPSQAIQASSPPLHQEPFTSELSESLGSNSNISKELGGIQPKTIRRSLNWQNITVEAPSPGNGMSLPGGIQRQQEEPGAVSGERVSADSAQKSALESSNSKISTSEPAQKPLIARAPFNGRNIPVEAPPRSSASSTYPGGIQRLETSGVKEQESTESLQMQPQRAIQAKSSEGEPQEKEGQNKESVQTKLTVGAPGDKYEQEADSMAAKVMRMPDSAIQQPIQRQTEEDTEAVQMQPLVNSIIPVVQRSSGKEEEVQMKSEVQRASDGSFVASGNVENQLAGSKGGGSALPDDVRSFMEPRFGADFSSVRVHTDSNAVQMNKELGAQAFAHGSDIYYGAGKSPGKDELTAHELTHTVQQGGAVRRTGVEPIGGEKRKAEDMESEPAEGGESQRPPQREAAKKARGNLDVAADTLAKQQGYSPAPSGHHWEKDSKNKLFLKRNPNQADKILELKLDPQDPKQFIPVHNTPRGYKWVAQGDNFIVKAESPGLPAIEATPQGWFVFKEGRKKGESYVPSSATGKWATHKWGDPSKNPCFPPGTVVKTPKGDRNIEDLVVGDLVIAYDFESKALVTQPVLHLYKNWTQHLVDTNVGGELITSTRRHPFWVESLGEWLPALELKSGMTLRTVAHNPVTVEFAKVYASDSTTYNLEVSQVHNYFVGTLGVLVHNGNDSAFESKAKKSAKIYEIVDSSSGQEVIVYRGKTTQGNVNQRFTQHLKDDVAHKSKWQEKYDQGQLKIIVIATGNWTDYETAVWEQHFIDQAVAKGCPLVNKLAVPPISKEKYAEFKHLHDPCS
jgi:hypothetical protein